MLPASVSVSRLTSQERGAGEPETVHALQIDATLRASSLSLGKAAEGNSRPSPSDRVAVRIAAFRASQEAGRVHRLQRSESIDLGLAVLSVLREPGETFSVAEIAAWCGCSPAWIAQIEQTALKKLRRAFECRFPDLAGEFRHFLRGR
jgi:hypothetical protein